MPRLAAGRDGRLIGLPNLLEQGRDNLVALLVLLLDRFGLFGSAPFTGDLALGLDPRVPPKDIGCIQEDFFSARFSRSRRKEKRIHMCLNICFIACCCQLLAVISILCRPLTQKKKGLDITSKPFLLRSVYPFEGVVR